LNSEIPKGYLTLIEDVSSDYLRDKIDLRGISRVLEIGCNSGHRLINLAIANPDLNFVGIDISPESIRVGNEYIADNGISNVTLHLDDVRNKNGLLSQFPSSSFDLVFTWATLIYISPIQIINVIKQISRLAGHKIVLLEQSTEKLIYWYNFRGIPTSSGNQFLRNYKKIITEEVPEVWDLMEDVELPSNIWKPGGGNARMQTYSKG
jgi:SAM-dependent methyltransferase